MLRHVAKQFAPKFIRGFATSRQNNHKVCVVGGAGGIGQPLSMLLKINPRVSDLCVYDLKGASGVAMDISHMDTGGVVSGLCGADNLKFALNCSRVVIIASGVPRKPGMQRSDLFKTNATMIAEIVQVFAKVCPKALLVIVTNPVNSLVPLAAEVLKKAGAFDPNRLFGCTTLDVVRARTFTGEFFSLEPMRIEIPVIGGHSNLTILPVFSQVKPVIREMDDDHIEKLINKVQEAGAAVVEAKGSGSATLSIAYATERLTNSLLMGLDGMGNTPIECSFVFAPAGSECEFFATPLRLGKEGISENLGIPPLNEMEAEMLKCLIPILKKDIELGKEFAKNLK